VPGTPEFNVASDIWISCSRVPLERHVFYPYQCKLYFVNAV
jgi:hypothetical protein